MKKRRTRLKISRPVDGGRQTVRLSKAFVVAHNFALFSHDRALKKSVLRQFHGEGFVNEYVSESVSADGKVLEFVTVRIENIPPGWKAKELYRIISPDEFVETFSLATPGKEFEVYSEAHLKRVK